MKYKFKQIGEERIAVLPKACPTNQRFSTRGFKPSSRFGNFKKEVESIKLCFQNKVKPIPLIMGKTRRKRNVHLEITYGEPPKDRMVDIDAYDKVVQDCVAGMLYEDDIQIQSKTVKICYTEEACVIVIAFPVEPDEHVYKLGELI